MKRFVRCLCFLSFDETNHVYDFCLRVLSFGFGSVEIKSVNDLGVNLSIVLVIEFLNHLQIFLAERMAVEAFPEIVVKGRDIPKDSEHDFCD